MNVIALIYIKGRIFAYRFQISSGLPDSAAPKMIDVWMFFHVFILAEVFISVIVINRIYERISKEYEKDEVKQLVQV